MSILTSVTDLLQPMTTLGNPSEECKQTKPDECGDDKHKGREESKNNDHEKQAKNDDHKNDDHRTITRNKPRTKTTGTTDKQARATITRTIKPSTTTTRMTTTGTITRSKPRMTTTNDDHRTITTRQATNDDHKNDDHKDDHSKHAKNDDCQQHKNDCQPQKDHCDAKPSDDCGKSGDTYHNPGEALAKFDFSHGNLGSAPDHSDTHAALASMSSDHALDYAIGQMSPAADHFDIAHDVPVHTSHDDVAHHA